jgi:hypothetical protein
MSDNDSVLLEDIDYKLAAILEGQTAMAHVPNDLAELKDDIREVKSDIKVIKSVLTGHFGELGTLDARVTKLERARS